MSEKRSTLPQGWECIKLDKIVFRMHQGVNTAADKVVFTEKNYPIIQSGNITSGKLVFDKNTKSVSDEDWALYKNKYKPSINNILLSNIGTIGKSIVVKNELDFLIHWNIFLIDLDSTKIDSWFFKYFLDKIDNDKYYDQFLKGATVKFVSKKVMSNLDVPLPPLEEQRRIVGKLDGLFGKIDKSIALLDESIASASSLMPSALNEVFEELGKKWKKKFLNQVTINHDGKRIPIKEDKRIKNINGYPYYGASGIVDYVDDYIFDGEYLLISEDGANLVIRKTPIAFIASGKFWVNNHAHIVQAIQDITSNKYLEYFFAYVDISLYITGAAQPKLSQKKLFEIPIIIPPLDIQTQTVAYLDALQLKAKALKKAQEKKKEELLALKASLLESAFKGAL